MHPTRHSLLEELNCSFFCENNLKGKVIKNHIKYFSLIKKKTGCFLIRNCTEILGTY